MAAGDRKLTEVDRRAVLCDPTDTVEIDARRDLLLADAILRDSDNTNQVKVA